MYDMCRVNGNGYFDENDSEEARYTARKAMAAEVGVDLDYVVPEEGSNVWFDGWAIPIYAKNPEAASYFINFLCMPENAIRNMEAIGYVSVIGSKEVMEGMMEDDDSGVPFVDASYIFGEEGRHVRLRQVYYPDKAVIDRCALMHDCADKTEAMVDMWSRVKGDSLNVRMRRSRDLTTKVSPRRSIAFLRA